MSGKIEKVSFSLGREYNERVGTNRRQSGCITKILFNNYLALFKVYRLTDFRSKDRVLRLCFGGWSFFLRASLGRSMEYNLKVENVNAPITVDVSIVVRARPLQYLSYDYLNVLDVDSVVAVGIPHIDLMTCGTGQRHPQDSNYR